MTCPKHGRGVARLSRLGHWFYVCPVEGCDAFSFTDGGWCLPQPPVRRRHWTPLRGPIRLPPPVAIDPLPF